MGDIEERIVTERVLTPQDIHERYNVLDGAIYGLASHGRVLGAFKPGNRSRQVEGLYLAGGSAHPGAGMPMALMSRLDRRGQPGPDARANGPVAAELTRARDDRWPRCRCAAGGPWSRFFDGGDSQVGSFARRPPRRTGRPPGPARALAPARRW